MKIHKTKSKTFILMTIILSLVIVFNIVQIVSAAITSVTINSIANESFFYMLPVNNYPISVTVNGGDSSTRVSLTYAGITQPESFTRTPGTNIWTMDNGWCPGDSDRVPGYQSSSGLYG